MRRKKWLKILLIIALGLLCLPCIWVGWEKPYRKPPPTTREPDMSGTWVSYYEYGLRGVDTLIIRADGTFKQNYQDSREKDYVYETTWNRWWLERYPDDRLWLHLEGARYYKYGPGDAETDGLMSSGRAYQYADPLARGYTTMVKELVLSVHIAANGRWVLVHMITGGDDPFEDLLTDRVMGFRRVGWR